ncbi:Uncharacterised protein [Mycobacterium tuberculosis]|nr:Uncharacterised protein [Mycobacterium tuberculosis]
MENRPTLPSRHFRKLVPPLNTRRLSPNWTVCDSRYSRWSWATSSRAASYASARPRRPERGRARGDLHK